MRKIHLDDRFISYLVRAFRSTTQWTVSSNVKFYLVHRSSSLVRSFQEARVAFTRARSFFNSCSIDRSARKPWGDQKRDLLRRQWPRDLFVYFRLKFHLEIQSFEITLIIRNSSYFIILQFYTLDEKDPRKLNNCNKIRFSKEHHPPLPFINFLSHH